MINEILTKKAVNQIKDRLIYTNRTGFNCWTSPYKIDAEEGIVYHSRDRVILIGGTEYCLNCQRKI